MKHKTAVREVVHDDAEWTVIGDNGGQYRAPLTSPIGQRIGDHLLDRMVTIEADDNYRITSLVLGEKAPPLCGCCNGAGMHEWRAYAGGRSPEDLDTECSNCAGNGRSWFNSRFGQCSGYRELMEMVHR